MKRAFTLLEVVVAMSILFLLFTLAFPTYATSRDKAKVARSLGQMRQIYLAYAQYRNDYQLDDNFIAHYGTGLPGYLDFSQLKIRSLLDTGGNRTPWPAAHYTVPQPTPGIPNHSIDEWNEYAETGRPTICLLDYTQNPGNPRDDVHKLRVVYGVYVDGRLERKQSRGILTRWPLWHVPE